MQSPNKLVFILLAAVPLPAEMVVCAPSTPLVAPGGQVTLAAWSDASPDRKTSWSWKTGTGTLTPGKSGSAVWNVGPADEGPQTAEVTLKSDGAAVGTCSVEVRVASSRPRGEGRAAFHAYLEANKPEPQGFGQYSYVLFGSAPKDPDKARYKAILVSLLTLVPASERLVESIGAENLNGNWIPVTEAPPAGTIDAQASWCLEHYDYTRSVALLSKVHEVKPTGIYLISGPGPWLSAQAKGPWLVQDLSAIPPNLVSTWVSFFVNQAAQVRYWDPSTSADLVLKLRLTLSVLAIGVPQVKEAVKNWVSLKS